MLPAWQSPEITSYCRHLSQSLIRLTGTILPDDVYHAPFVLVSHGVQDDPVFCYANIAAQTLWGYSWDEFTRIPSRLSAEPDAREERERLLRLADQQGYVDNYHGIRITKGGKRFRICECLLWNIDDDNAKRIGQAAMFDRWEWI